MNKKKKMFIGMIGALGMIFSGISGNMMSSAADISSGNMDMKPLSDNKMLFSKASSNTGLLTNSHTYYVNSTKALLLTQQITWKYGVDIGDYPIGDGYKFTAEYLTTGISYKSVEQLYGQKVMYQNKKATRYKEIGEFDWELGKKETGIFMVCNSAGQHNEGFLS